MLSVRQIEANREVISYRKHRGIAHKLINVYIVSYFLFHVCFVAGLYSTKFIQMADELYAVISVLATLIAVVLLVNATKKKDSPRYILPWYDILLLVAIFIGCGYMVVNASEALVLQSKQVETADIVWGVITILAVVELVRRTLGRLLAAIFVLVFLYAMFSNYFPGILWSTGFSLERMIGQCYLFSTGMFGDFALLLARMLVIMFLFVGLISVSGAGKFLMNLALALVGRTTGGPAKVAVGASGLVGAIAPAGGPNVAFTGSMTIPMMKNMGLKGEYAGAVEAVSSIGGAIMPPIIGVSGLLMCDFLNIGYDVAITAALVPGLLYYIYLFFSVHFDCLRYNLTKPVASKLPHLKGVLKEGWQYTLPILVLVIAIMVLHTSIQRSCLFAIVALMVVGLFRKEDRLTPKRLLAGAQAAMRLVVLIGPIIVGIGVMMASFFITGMPLRLSALMVQVSGGHLFPLLVMAAFACYILGTGMPTWASYLMLAILVAPALIRMGVAPIAAHLFIIYTSLTHFITPPSMSATYIAAGIAEASPWRTSLHALRLGICLVAIPFLFVYNPSLLIVYSPGVLKLIATLITAVIGILSFTSGMAGFLLKEANWLQRILLIASGILLLGPTSLINTTAGLATLALVLLWQWIAPKWPLRKRSINLSIKEVDSYRR